MDFFKHLDPGTFGTQPRFKLVAESDYDAVSLRGLGTYGFIKNAPSFIIGATDPVGNYLEDFGYLMETIILFITNMNLHSCWLGGSFTRSSFANRISAGNQEVIPAVTAVGCAAPVPRKIDSQIRRIAKSDQRLPWETLFFDRDYVTPLRKEKAGDYGLPLEMVRLGPSASNKQPWRIVMDRDNWHFYLQRTPGYQDKLHAKLLKMEDLQRVDMGIAMCHFELSTNAAGLRGNWQINPYLLKKPNPLGEYLVSWVPGSLA